ncbi:MAG: DNA alkylation repair protein, partial [Gemmatimonadales bacterium]
VMKKTEAIRELKAMGTAQTRKVYAQHGVSGDVYGVSYANLGNLKKKIKQDHQLAEQLWATGNHDARVLATMIADPQQMNAKTLDTWVRDVEHHGMAAAFSGVARRARGAKARTKKWIAARDEWKCTTGWDMLAGLAETDVFTDDELAGYVEVIERGIHDAKNRVKYSMNNAVIAIGLRPKLRKNVIAAAKRIGKVEVDHGKTGCKTPDAASYIAKTVEHRRKKSKTKKP